MDIEDLYQKYGPMVMRRCRQLLGNEQEALDATQDVFIQVLKHESRLKLDYPSSLLYRIATNLCLNRIRDRRRRAETSDDDALNRIADLDDTGARVEARSMLHRLFHGHQESSRTIAVLHFVDGMTLEETAHEVGMSVSGVRKRLSALRATLKTMEAS
jgi:RNA polymerase sigma-70 factor (ECF subfamily)